MLSYGNRRLHFEGRDLTSIVERIGTPAFLISEARLVDNARALSEGLSAAGHEVHLRYCAKTNNQRPVLRVLAAEGHGVLASHVAEAQRAVEAGFTPDMVALQRPVLTRSEVREAMDLGVRRFHLYQPGDVDTLQRCAAALDQTLDVSLRVATRSRRLRVFVQRFPAARLGMRGEEALDSCRRVQAAPNLRLRGLNFHCGTQLESPEAQARMIATTAGLMARVEHMLGITFEEFNVGGGFPSPSLRVLDPTDRLRPVSAELPHGDEPDRLRQFASGVADRVRRSCDEAGVRSRPRLVAEPGRGVVGNAAILLTRVHSVRGRWVYLDATRNWLPESPLLFCRAFAPLLQPADRRTRAVHVSGSTLNSMDVIDLFHRLPASLAPDDVLALCDAGAYTLSRASRYASGAARSFVLTGAGELTAVDGDRPSLRPAPTESAVEVRL